MPRSQETRRLRLLCLLLAAVTLAVYSSVGRFEFTNYDDPDYVTGNSYVTQGLTWAGASWAFQTGHAGNWHPLTWLSHMLDVQLFGLNAGWHHLTNLLFHTANAILLLLVMRKLTQALWPSAIVAALFALHPLHIESVAWIAERKDVLSTFFGLLSLWTYAGYVKGKFQADREMTSGGERVAKSLRAGRYYGLTLVFFALSLMSKPMLVTLPCLLLLLDFWPLKRFQLQTKASVLSSLSPLLREKIPFLALSLASSVITLLVQARGHSVASLADLPASARLQTTVVAYLSYLGQAFWPVHLAVFYPHPGSWPAWQVVAASVIVVAVSAVAIRFIRQKPYLFVGWFWFLGTLVPAIGLVQVGLQARADRYTYFPLTGIFIILVWGLRDALAAIQFRTALLVTAATGTILACGAATWWQLRHWVSSETLFSHALRVTTNNYVAHLNLGVALWDRGKTNEAVTEYFQSLRIRPENAPALGGIGQAMLARGNTNEAVSYYRRALQFDPAYPEANYELGTIAASQGAAEAAIEHFESAIRRRPDYPEAHYNLALALTALNKSDAALAHFAEAARLRPDDAETHNNFGIALASRHNLDEAVAEFELALRARPHFADAHYNLALARLQQGRVNDAVAQYELAIRCRPGWIPAMNNLAWLLATHPDSQTRNGRRALALAQQACQLTGNSDISLLQTLAAAYAECGQFANASATARTAYDLSLATGQTAWTNTARLRLEQYTAGQPLRQPPAP